MSYTNCKIYTITNGGQYTNIKILRFSHNGFEEKDMDQVMDEVMDEVIDEDKTTISSLLKKLEETAKNEEKCYNSIYPWKDIYKRSKHNREIIIAYNEETYHIQGWCNIILDKFQGNPFYTLCVDKLVTRAEPKIKYIGLLLLEFIRDECVNKNIIYLNKNERDRECDKGFYKYKSIKINVMYLYSLTTSINFYKKTFLTQMTRQDITHPDQEIIKHVFIYYNKDYAVSNRINTEKLTLLYILHIFECNSVMSIDAINTYTQFNPPDECKNNGNDDIFKQLVAEIRREDNYKFNRISEHRNIRRVNYAELVDEEIDEEIDSIPIRGNKRCKYVR
jgi:hypothetical protein